MTAASAIAPESIVCPAWCREDAFGDDPDPIHRGTCAFFGEKGKNGSVETQLVAYQDLGPVPRVHVYAEAAYLTASDTRRLAAHLLDLAAVAEEPDGEEGERKRAHDRQLAGRSLRVMREACGLTQRKLAELAGVSLTEYGRIERGQTGDRYATARLCQVLGTHAAARSQAAV